MFRDNHHEVTAISIADQMPLLEYLLKTHEYVWVYGAKAAEYMFTSDPYGTRREIEQHIALALDVVRAFPRPQSTEQNPIHHFIQPGEFFPTLFVGNQYGFDFQIGTELIQINVYDASI